MGHRIRAFIAVPLPAEVRDHARRLQGLLQEQGLGMRWVKPDAIHLTLKFLGDIDNEQVPVLEKALAAVALGTPPLALAVKGLGVFPNVKKARVLWMGLAGETALLHAAHKRLETQLVLMGYKPEKRRYSAHLTLARARGVLDPHRLVRCMEAAGGFEAVAFTARQMVLYQSDLRPGGAVYTVLVKKSLEHSGQVS